MKIKICYNLEDICKVLNMYGYDLVKLPIVHEDEDSYRKMECYYFAKPEVSSIEYYHSLWTSAAIMMKDGSHKRALGSNVNSNDNSVVRINDNDFISPALMINDTWVESTDILTSWLTKHGVSMDLLDSCKKEFAVYETIEYFGVPTPSKHHGYWGYSSEALVLDEKEIEEALNSIQDELLRKKIE